LVEYVTSFYDELIENRNKGDSAIFMGEVILLKTLGIDIIYTCNAAGLVGDVEGYNATRMRETLSEHGGPSKTAIMFHGGGNFGDVWKGGQHLRELVAMDFKDYPIRSFPQTYHFKDKEKLAISQRIYGEHPNLQLTVRDSKSYSQLQIDFGTKHRILLAPDAATMLYTIPVVPNPTRPYNFLVQFRNDREGGQRHTTNNAIVKELYAPIQNSTTVPAAVLIGDWGSCEPTGLASMPHIEKGAKRVQAAQEWLRSAELVLSDRLHVHILSTIWGIDHVVIEEGWYQKITTYHDTWLLECTAHMALANNLQEGVDAAKSWFENGHSFT
jgi:exopolysaccharide biosynthesis predicted pyruvyltransferase EpsI